MGAKTLLDFDFLVNQEVQYGVEDIRKVNPQRYDMEHLTAIIHVDRDEQLIAGYKDVTDQEFWVKGHLPDRPLLPGVIMLEAGAQLCSICYHSCITNPNFFGFAAMNDVRFRGTVVPGDRLYLVAKGLDLRPTRGYFQAQGLVKGKIVFEAKILGMAV